MPAGWFKHRSSLSLRRVRAPARRCWRDFAAQERPVAGFDVNPDDFKLSDYLPGYTAAASLSDIRGEMALFDQLVMADTTAKVVDLAHGMFDRFFAVMRQVDVAGEARRRGVVPIVLYTADPDDRGRQGYAMLAGRFPDLALVPVLNHAVPQVARYRDRFPANPYRRRRGQRTRAIGGVALDHRPAGLLVHRLRQ
jgi:hypothetical protein